MQRGENLARCDRDAHQRAEDVRTANGRWGPLEARFAAAPTFRQECCNALSIGQLEQCRQTITEGASLRNLPANAEALWRCVEVSAAAPQQPLEWRRAQLCSHALSTPRTTCLQKSKITPSLTRKTPSRFYLHYLRENNALYTHTQAAPRGLCVPRRSNFTTALPPSASHACSSALNLTEGGCPLACKRRLPVAS